MMEKKLKKKHLFNEVVNKYVMSAISAYSGQSAFFMMLSFFPFMIFFFSLLNLTPLTQQDFFLWISNLIPEAFQDTMRSFVVQIYSGSNTQRAVTVVMALWLSSKAFLSIQQGLNSMYQTRETRNYVLLRIYSVIYSAVLAVLLIVTLAIVVFGKTLHTNFFEGVRIVEHIINISGIIYLPVLFIFFWLLYYFLPNKKQRIKAQIPGAVFAAAAWGVFSYFFSIYASDYNNYASFYGAMTTIALIMVWIYGCMYVLFIGGLINSYLEEKRQK